MPRQWVIDAVEVYNATALANCKKRLTADLDAGYATLTGGYGHALIRKVETTTEDGHAIYQDTNNSSNDFYEANQCSLR